MDRLACANLPAFPLQLLCRRHPDWKQKPVVVVAEDKPQAVILWVNEQARRAGVLPGQRYAYGLSLSRELRAGVVAGEEIEKAVFEVAELLRKHSPEVDPCDDEPGVFWLNGAGLTQLYGSPESWGRRVYRELCRAGYRATVVVGFSRFATYAVARERGERAGFELFRDKEEESARTRRVELARLGIRPELRDVLARLGVVDLGGFLRLPADGLRQRFGAEAHRLHALAAGELWDPLRPKYARAPLEQKVLFDDPVTQVTQLVFAMKRAVNELVSELAEHREALAALYIEFSLYRRGEPCLHTIEPAESTLDARVIMRLVHLRLEAEPPPAGVEEILLRVREVPATREQLNLFAQKPRRDLRSANEALARLRAELGNDAVVCARLCEGHLPEARFAWGRLTAATLPKPRADAARVLIRRIFTRPLRLPPKNQGIRDDGWLILGHGKSPVVRIAGPYVISGGWWNAELHREYHYAETGSGDALWVFYDRRRRRWFLHGIVE